MKQISITLLLAAVVGNPLLAGVVYDIEVKNHNQSPPTTESVQASVEGRNLKMGIASSGRSGAGDMVYRGASREMLAIDHSKKSYFLMDEAGIEQLAGQVSGAMAQMEEALKNLPEDRRAMVEEMMKKRMPAQQPARPKSELRKTSETGVQNGYPCVKYEVFESGRKVRELWVTDWSNVEGGDEVVTAFEDMAGFFQQLLDAMPQMGQAAPAADSAFARLEELGGFPVVTREFADDGTLETESTLRSASRRTIDAAEFEPPSGYKRQAMITGQ